MTGSFAPNAKTAKLAVYGKRGVVAAQNTKAARAGAEILGNGGNAMDAAIATSFALAACEPWMSGLGGGGSMIHYDAASNSYSTIDFNMVAPLALDPADFPLENGGVDDDLFGWPAVKDDRHVKGPYSMAVPGQLRGIALAHKRFASMPISELLQPAIALAREGLEVDWFASFLITSNARDLKENPTARETFLEDGFPPVPDWAGQTVYCPVGRLADTLETLAIDGLESFYRGDIANSILSDLRDTGSFIARNDFDSIEAIAREPLTFSYRHARISAMDGLYAGPSLAMALESVSQVEAGGDWPVEEEFLAYAAALKSAFAHRLRYMGEGAETTPSCTSHHNAIDAQGNMVSMTQTLLSLFGSKVMLPGTGILMNNGVMWFDPRPGRANSMAPGRRPLSNMCPVIAETPELRLALGASGGRKIMPAVMQILCAMIDHGMSLEEAFAQPRIDVSGTEMVAISDRLWDPIPEVLAAHHPTRIITPSPYPLAFACPSAVMHDLVDGYRYGTAEISQPWADAVVEPDTLSV